MTKHTENGEYTIITAYPKWMPRWVWDKIRFYFGSRILSITLKGEGIDETEWKRPLH